MSALVPNLIHFARLLGALGVDAHAYRSLEVVRALDHVEIGHRSDFYYTLRCLLVRHPRDLERFDAAFRVFWRPPAVDWTSQDLRAMGEQRRAGKPTVGPPAGAGDSASTQSPARPLTVERVAAQSASDREVLQKKDFVDLTPDELAEARRMLTLLRWNMGLRRTRRWQAGRGTAADLRRVMQTAHRHGGEPIVVPTHERRKRPRPLVLLCDVSGSMERYSRMLLHFVYCMTGRVPEIEAFVFATRLTRITRILAPHRGRATGPEIVSRLPGHVPDFAGGTRIGAALRDFNIRWARRVLGHGAVALVISDGWDRGDPDRLRGEMARLKRSVHRLIWLNPLLGSPSYEPLTRGISAALPFIDDFLPVHNLESLTQLGEHLNALPERRRGASARLHAATG